MARQATLYASARDRLPCTTTKLSSFCSLAEAEKLWDPVTTLQSSEKGSITIILECVIAWPTPGSRLRLRSRDEIRASERRGELWFCGDTSRLVFRPLRGENRRPLDRQHPRDLFDIRDLLANEGITDDLRRAFIVYLISHDRPISEVVVPRRKDIRQEFEHGFEGMTADPVSLDELLKAREDLIAEVSGKMPKEHREFLIGFKRGKPDWALLGVGGAAELPAVRWKQINLDELRAADREKLVAQLIAVLN
ncbi:hypothetical protein ABIB90_006204 [Bradyrhizobium sp. JR4.1]